MRRFFKRPVVLISTAVLLVVFLILWWLLHGSSKLSFRTAVVKRGDVAATISASGTIEPVEVVDIGAQVAGIIKSFGTDTDGKTIDYGSTVAEGAVLAKIDDSVYTADLSVAKAGELSADANLEQMNAKLDQAAAEWERAQELFTNKLLARVDYDTDKANYEVAKANVSVAKSGVAEAQAALEKAQRNLDFCIIKSPVSGVVIDRRVNIGQTVVSSLNAPSLFLIAQDLTKMQIWVAVNEADIGRIKARAPVTFTCDALPGREFQGMVGKVRLNATMTQNVVMFTVEVNMENRDKVLLPYLTANVHFITKKESNVLLVPNAALRWSPSSLEQIAPAARSQIQTGNSSKADKKESVIWLREGEYVRPVTVTAGTSDGLNTAVTGDNLVEGAEIVTGETTESSLAATKNPFLPQIMRR